ncbi:hypothetical protein F4809DRAFT_617183 [Biscogniauxia mediterranea]|nr:hypothetical protein F4809DRAFT_617183 [Biscogniauxia mediterranea]
MHDHKPGCCEFRAALWAICYTTSKSTGLNDVGVIEIEGEAFFIRRNIHDFLRTITGKSEFGLFFVDPICINQLPRSRREAFSSPRDGTHLRQCRRSRSRLGFPELDE